MRRTKIICTIGPKTCDYESLKKLAEYGMNVARLNMSHGEHEWHQKVIRAIKRINEKTEYSIAIMLDTKGPEIRTGDLEKPIKIQVGEEFIFTTNKKFVSDQNCTSISYSTFHKDVIVGDVILVDGGLLSFRVINLKDKNVVCECIDGGEITSRRHINIRGKSAKLPSITKKDWEDIEFGVKEGIDYIALSFVKDRKSILELRKFLNESKHPVEIIAKIESAEAIEHIEDIIEVSDCVMVARGDLGAELPVEEVPVLQEEIVKISRIKKKPVIVATNLLESMIVNPTPTRAEVSDIAVAVDQKADAIMLSGETAMGKYPYKAVEVMDLVSKRIEQKNLKNKKIEVAFSSDSKIELARSASIMANNLNALGIIVFTRSGHTSTLLSYCRPHTPIFAFTNTSYVRRRLNLYWGVTSFRIDFSKDPEKTIKRSFEVLKERGLLKAKDLIVVASDILVDEKFVQSIQIREVQ